MAPWEFRPPPGERPNGLRKLDQGARDIGGAATAHISALTAPCLSPPLRTLHLCPPMPLNIPF